MKAPLTPLDFLARSASVYRDKIALVDADRRFSFDQLQARVHRLGTALRQAGIQPGDRVAVLASNCAMAVEAHFAVPLIGAVLVMLNTRLQAAELKWILDHSEARLLLTEPRSSPAIDPVRGQLAFLTRIVDDHEAFLEEAPPGLIEPVQPEEDGLLAINYTSGTTGVPKGVMFTHRGAYLNALGEAMEHGLRLDSVYLWTLPMFHCNGWCFPWAAVGIGARQVCLPKVEAPEIVRLIEAEGVTHLCGAPVVVSTLAQYCETNSIRFPRKLTIVTAGAPPSPAVIAAAEATGAEISHAYGLTETYGPMTVCAWRSEWNNLTAGERSRLKARQGVPYLVAGTGLRVVDSNLRDVPADGESLGEVVMRGNNVMLGYYRNPEGTAQAFEGGWFHSGDLAVMHPNSYIEIRDRKKDIVISGGENISSIEVEKVLFEHPAVLEAAVVAMPDEKWGEVPKAFVGLKPGQTATAEELIAYCRTRLAHFKCPKQIEFGMLPKTATGKVRKNELRARSRASSGA